jgi:PHD/YefM family antitoxin component YafN of YafNO toxin-antitoxin module
MPVTIMRLTDQRANLAFSADEEAEHQLTMYLLDSPATQESLLETA